jgi:hypothetical protein
VVAKVGLAIGDPDGKLDGSRELRDYIPKSCRYHEIDQFDVELANPVKLASFIVQWHRIGQFSKNGHFGLTVQHLHNLKAFSNFVILSCSVPELA